MSEERTFPTVGVVAVLGIIVIFSVALWRIAHDQRSDAIEKGKKTAYTEAVKAGVARWILDEKGEPKIEWIVPLEKKP